MPNVAAVLREEISRLARKELRSQIGPVRKQNAGLRRQMQYVLYAVITHQRGNLFKLAQVQLVNLEAREVAQHIETGLLERDVIIVVQTVDADDGKSVLQQALSDMEADKAGCTSHEDWAVFLHCFSFSSSTRRPPLWWPTMTIL